MSDAPPDYDAQLRIEFRDQIQDRLAGMNAHLGDVHTGQSSGKIMAPLLLREAQTIKGLAAGYSYPTINLVAQRLEAYLDGLTELTPRDLEAIQRHIDRLGTLVEQNETPDAAATAALLQELPTRYDFKVGDVSVRHVEIMVVTPTRVLGKVVSGELAACGYRPVLIHDPLEAFQHAVRVPPGMLMASATMAPISGIELVRALKQLQILHACPMAVLTSLDADTKPLHTLPPEVAIIHTGTNFGADFATATARFNLG
jgi:CheY-like chemotaxis protein